RRAEGAREGGCRGGGRRVCLRHGRNGGAGQGEGDRNPRIGAPACRLRGRGGQEFAASPGGVSVRDAVDPPGGTAPARPVRVRPSAEAHQLSRPAHEPATRAETARSARLTRASWGSSVGRVTCSVVCISHASGAGGDEVGRIVAERLGFLYVDEEIIARAAAKGGIDQDDVADVERRRSIAARLLEAIAQAGGSEAWALASPPPSAGEQLRSADVRALILETIEQTA